MSEAPLPTPCFIVDAAEEGQGFRIAVSTAGGPTKTYFVPTGTQQDFSSFFRELSEDLGTRRPHVFADAIEHAEPIFVWGPATTENVHPQILAGYGDPAV